VYELTQIQLIRRIAIYNYMIVCYEKYLMDFNVNPGHLTEATINFIYNNYCSFSWFRIKLNTLISLLKLR